MHTKASILTTHAQDVAEHHHRNGSSCTDRVPGHGPYKKEYEAIFPTKRLYTFYILLYIFMSFYILLYPLISFEYDETTLPHKYTQVWNQNKSLQYQCP